MSPSRDLDRHVVTAVIVVHDGARWLPEVLEGLLSQSRPADHIAAADTGSLDDGFSMLTTSLGDPDIVRLPSETGFGAAVAEVLPEASGGKEWIWLLHDDSAPAPDALEQLLATAGHFPKAAVLGPKLRHWTDRWQLAEVGVTLDGAGRRATGLEPEELDQGQHDGTREVLAVSSAGMLIRRDVWDDLGGFDSRLGLFRDDIDLCLRARGAGHRVLVVTDAVMYHAEATSSGLRPVAVAGASPGRNGLYVLFAHLPAGALLVSLLRNTTGYLVRALLLLIAKRPAQARAETAALYGVLAHPWALRRARTERARGRRRARSALRRFKPRRRLTGGFLDGSLGHAGRHQSTKDSSDPAPSPTFTEPLLRLLTRPAVALTLALTLIALVAGRSILATGGDLAGGALMPAVGGASDLWSQYLAGWHPTGIGSEDGAPPYVALLALISTVTLGKPWLAVMLLLLGGVPLAGLTAYAASRHVVPAPWPRVWVAATYALLPVVTGAVSSGRLGAIVVAVLLPVLGLVARRMFMGGGHAAWTAGLLLTVMMAFAPLTWLLALTGGLIAGAATGQPAVRRNLLISLAIPPLVLLPWTLTLLRHPSRFLLEAGPHPSAEPVPDAASLLAFNPGGPGTPAAVVTAGLLAVGVVALLSWQRRSLVLLGWMTGLAGLLVAVLCSAATVSMGPDPAPAWPGVALVVAATGVLLAAAIVVHRAWAGLRTESGLRRIAATVLLVVAGSVPAGAAVSWVATPDGGMLDQLDPDVTHALVSDSGGSKPRTLVLREEPGGRVAYSLLRGRLPGLGESEATPPGDARRRLDAVVAGLAAGRDEDGPALARFGVQYVLAPRPADGRLGRTLDASPRLSRLSRTPGFALWRLDAPGGRLALVDGTEVTPLPAGQTDARVRIPPGPANRLLTLAEPASDGWRATIDGAKLPSRKLDGWAQAYEVPTAGGEFELSRSSTARRVWVAIQALAVLLLIVAALPGRWAGVRLPGRSAE